MAEADSTPAYTIGASDLSSKRGRQRRKRNPGAPLHPVKPGSSPAGDASVHPIHATPQTAAATDAPVGTAPDVAASASSATPRGNTAETVAAPVDSDPVGPPVKVDSEAAAAPVEEPQPEAPAAAAEPSATPVPDDRGDAGEEALPSTQDAPGNASAGPVAEAGVEPDPGPARNVTAESAPDDATSRDELDSGKHPADSVVAAAEVAWTRPTLKRDRRDPTTRIAKGTTAKVAASIMKRFNTARRNAPSHTAILNDALRAHAGDLDKLVLRARPEIWQDDDDDLPLRHLTADTEGKADLRIRPTVAELAYIKELVESLNTWLQANWEGVTPTTQSEVFTVVLDEYLPKRAKAAR